MLVSVRASFYDKICNILIQCLLYFLYRNVIISKIIKIIHVLHIGHSSPDNDDILFRLHIRGVLYLKLCDIGLTFKGNTSPKVLRLTVLL